MDSNYWKGGARISRRAALRAGALAGGGLAAAALVGCGADDPATSPPGGGTPSGGGDGSPTPAATADPGDAIQGGTLRFAHGSAIAHFDPHQSVTPASQTTLWHLIGNQLIRTHASQLVIEGDLAESWEIQDPQNFVFNMHRNAAWQDIAPLNGRQVTAEDVIYSFERTQTDQESYARRSQYRNVEAFEALDDSTLRVRLSEPSVPFLSTMADLYETVVAQEIVEQHGDLKLHESAHGSGPFIMQMNGFDKEIGGTFTRNPNYWKTDDAGNQLPYLDGIQYQFIGDAAAIYAALTTGRVDVGGVSPENLEDFRRGNPDWQITEVLGLSRDGLLLNVEREPFTDIRVRQALSHLVDRYLIRDLGRGAGTITPAVAPAMGAWTLPAEELAQMPGYRLPDDTAGIEADRQEGVRLLDAAGGGFELDMFTSTSYSYNLLAETTAPQLEQYGIKLNIVLQEWGILKEHEANGTYTIAASNWYSGPEPDLHLHLYHHRDGGRNYSNLDDPELNSLLERQRVEIDEEARRELIYDAQRRIHELAAPVWILAPSGTSVQAPHVRNYSVRAMSAAWNDETIWFEN